MTINSKAQTIEMTKKFANFAKRFGSVEYDKLQTARRDYPSYKVIVKNGRSPKRNYFKGLSYEYMENYIQDHDDENGSIMKKYQALRATSEEAKEIGAVSMTYAEIKDWFFKVYPAFAKFKEARKEIRKSPAA